MMMCRLYRWTWYGVSVRTCGVVVATMLIYLPSFPLGTCLNRANDRRWAIQQKRSTEARMPSQWSRIRSAGRLRDAASLSGAPRTGAVFTWVAECHVPNSLYELWTHTVKYITGLIPSFKRFRRELSRYRLRMHIAGEVSLTTPVTLISTMQRHSGPDGRIV